MRPRPSDGQKVFFDAQRGDVGPYGVPLPGLDDGAHNFHAPELGEPDGFCPLCNNDQHEEYDTMLRDGASSSEVAQRSGFSVHLVERHASLHLWPLYGQAFRVVFGDRFLKGSDAAVHASELQLYGPAGAILRAPEFLQKRVAELWAQKLSPRGVSVMETFEKAQGDDLDSSLEYAIQDGKAVRPLHAWDDTRMAKEASVRARQAINFYDEMMDIRACAMDVYGKTMDECDVKFYPIALAALRERRAVIETLAKMSLVAKQMSDEEDGRRKLSPGIKNVVDSLFALAGTDETKERGDEGMTDE